MRRRFVLIAAAALVGLAGATAAVGGGRGLIFDEGSYVRAGSLDDGKDLLPETAIPLAQANETAQRVAEGPLGQVDLERFGDRIVFSVDIGSQEVRVDAVSGLVVDVRPRD